MKSTSHWVEEAVLREGAFELFASSSAGRYFSSEFGPVSRMRPSLQDGRGGSVSAVPSGLVPLRRATPRLKTWAIVERPSGTTSPRGSTPWPKPLQLGYDPTRLRKARALLRAGVWAGQPDSDPLG